MAIKTKERDDRAEQELIDAGMLQLKGRGKKKAAERQANRETGLNEIEGFTPGLLVVKDAPKNLNWDRGLAKVCCLAAALVAGVVCFYSSPAALETLKLREHCLQRGP